MFFNVANVPLIHKNQNLFRDLMHAFKVGQIRLLGISYDTSIFTFIFHFGDKCKMEENDKSNTTFNELILGLHSI